MIRFASVLTLVAVLVFLPVHGKAQSLDDLILQLNLNQGQIDQIRRYFDSFARKQGNIPTAADMGPAEPGDPAPGDHHRPLQSGAGAAGGPADLRGGGAANGEPARAPKPDLPGAHAAAAGAVHPDRAGEPGRPRLGSVCESPSNGGGGFAALRRIVIRTYTWLNWLYPLPFRGKETSSPGEGPEQVYPEHGEGL